MDQSYKKIRSFSNITGTTNERIVNTLPFERDSNIETGIFIKDTDQSLYIDNPSDETNPIGKITKVRLADSTTSNTASMTNKALTNIKKGRFFEVDLTHLTVKKNIIAKEDIECRNLHIRGDCDKLKTFETEVENLLGLINDFKTSLNQITGSTTISGLKDELNTKIINRGY